MIQIRSRIVAVSFAILLLLPTIDKLVGLSAWIQSTENRQPAPLPSFHFPHVRQFVVWFDQHYKENFGGRNALFYMYSRLKYKVLGQSPLPEKVVVGKEGWFYLGNSYNKVVDQHRGLVPLSDKEASQIAEHLTKRQQELAKQGIKFYVMIAPDSHTIYPEYLPDHLQQSNESSRLDVLKRAMVKTTVPFIDIRDTLLAAKRTHRVYYQTDTHWNDYGTLVGCVALLNRIRQDKPATPSVQQSDYHIKQWAGINGDLTRMLMLQDNVDEKIAYEIRPMHKLTSRETAVVPREKNPLPSHRFAGSGTDRLLFIGDSFSISMMQYLPAYFRESYFVRDGKLDDEAIHTEHPTILVLEIVERNISQLATF
ncbi:alginate O-acetyltransferase AlgX-related protein [Spirosoma foliorum]|uniref:AlgX/AlgJ SGNH hydrolase-like domain-containing protein n=1 Tax=Spirosoma foliorum TaxID=2710596 RepID=A0A7G5GTX7_9BACT|nr:hypothetical protein [Spirosoma foliorum]QMW02319.1 hypothetical protein H3H32_31090 [Spirosoma foliorum]